MIAATLLSSDMLVPVLARLNRGELIEFSHFPGGPLAFSVGKIGRSFVMCDVEGRALASASTFAETWRRRPQPS